MGSERNVSASVFFVAVVVGVASCSSEDDSGNAGGSAGKGGKSGGTAGAGGRGGASGASSGGRSGNAGNGNAGSVNGGEPGAGAVGGTTGGASGADDGGAGVGGAATGDLTDGYASGSRLRAVLEVAGSAKRFVSWHDVKLDIDCTFARAADGKERCLPGYGSGYAAYGDDECKTRVAVYYDADAPPRYIPDPAYEFTCGAGEAYLAVGETIETVATTYYQAENGDCVLGETLPADRFVAELGARVADTIFVAASDTTQEPRDSRVAANVRTASDGSREVASFQDLTRDAVCNPLEHQGEGYACVPWDRAYIQVYFADDTCETPAAFHPGYAQQTCGRPPKIVQNSAPNSTDSFFEVGAELDGQIYRDDGADCAPYAAPADLGASYYAVGKEVPWSGLAPFVATNEGTGRILENTLRVPSGALIAALDFYDSTLETRCSASLATDGTTRCLPRVVNSVNVFADADCNEGLFAVPTGTEVPAAGTFFIAPTTTNAGAIFSMGKKISAPAQTWQFNGYECVEAEVTENQDWYDTKAHAPAEFVSVTREVE